MRYEFEFNSFGDAVIKGYKWINEETPSRILVISHGMAETIERYDEFANYMLSKGIFVFGHAHRGHGKTAGSVENLGYLGENGWFKMKEDLRRVIELVRDDYPDAPLILMGHSMGSFLVRDFILDYTYLVSGVILSGTGYPSKLEIGIAKWLAEREYRKNKVDEKSILLNRISFGTYNKKIENPLTAFDWLSRDPVEVKKYIEDPYCGEIHPTSFYIEFTSNLQRILYSDVFKNQKNGLPMLIFSGNEDPVGNYGKGVKKTNDYYKQNGFNTSLRLYPKGRHEMLNEINKKDVYEDILKWISLNF